MANKVNGIKIYPKHSLGSILSASFGVFAGFMLIIGLTFFPILGATINGTVSQVNAFDYLLYSHSILIKLDFLSGLAGITHFLAPSKYSGEFFNYLHMFKAGAHTTGNYAVGWYPEAAQYGFDVILHLNYLLLMFFGLYLLIEGIIRLATGTFHKTAKPFTIVCFFLMLFFMICSFFTNFCAKYLALELMPEGETYVPKACPMQYILFFLMLACWIVQNWVYNKMIKGKLYVADARLIKGQKEEPKQPKRSKKASKEEEIPEEEVVVEETPLKEVPVEQPAPEPAPKPVPEAPKEERAPSEQPVAESVTEAPAAKESAHTEEPKVAPEEAKKSE